MSVSAFCFASEGALVAAPLLGVRLHLPFGPRVALRVPAPDPTAAPKRRGFFGDGPIVLRGDGTYQLALNRSNRNGFGDTATNYSTALSLVAERRTERSALSLSSGLGYGSGAFSAGTMILGYRTPGYGLTYGAVAGPSDTQLQIGGLARGISLAIPSRSGEISYFAATAEQTDRSTNRVYGLRRSWNALGGLLSASGYYSRSEDGAGRQAIADVGLRRYGARVSSDAELALSNTRGIAGAPDGTHLATALHLDLQGTHTFTTLGLRFDPGGFQTLTGTLDGGFSADLAMRRRSERYGDLAIDVAHSDQRLYSEVQHDDRVTVSGGRNWSSVGLQYVAGLDGIRFGGTTSLQRTAAVTLTESVHGVSLTQTAQATSATGASGAATQSQISLGASRALAGGIASVQLARSSVASGDASSGNGLVQSYAYRHGIGKKLDVQVTQSIQTTGADGVASRLVDTGVSLVRRISNVVALQVNADVFRSSGIGGGKGSAVSAYLIGPFGFGAKQGVAGRPNPNLPSVIRGVVTYSSSTSPFGSNNAPLRGYNNALVLLDGRISQRTDANGEFEFRFVPAGTHTIRLDPATIAPGMIADRDNQTIQVLGGQTASLQFAIGNFAGVAGSVVATDNSGKRHALGDVAIAVDGIQAVTTAPDGHYAVGRLSPGAHTIEVVETTLPSTVAFVGEKKKTVTVTPGMSTPVDFVATPLGSIGGTVLAPSGGGFGPLAGLKNVYVVADPGDHAAITEDDGSFLLDNLPPGNYTLTVDPETIPDGLGVLSGPEGPVALQGGASLSNIAFKLGGAAKTVVLTYSQGHRLPIQVDTGSVPLPPGALLRITARTSAAINALRVESDVFGTFPLKRDAGGAWTATTIIPALTKGDYGLTVSGERKDVVDGTALVAVDPRVPLLSLRMSPRDPLPGHTVRVLLHALAPIEAGDMLEFEDGYRFPLPSPQGRTFAFEMRVWRRGLPYSGTIHTKHGSSYPLSLR